MLKLKIFNPLILCVTLDLIKQRCYYYFNYLA
jgi:hypothetical protein